MANEKPYALLLNDIHISKDNIAEFKLNWNEAISICKKRKISKLIIGGDLFQSRSSQSLDVLLAVKSSLLKAYSNDIEVIIAEGNHDKVDQEACEGYAHVFENKNMGVSVIDIYKEFEIGEDVSLYVMSYFPENGSFVEELKELILDMDRNRYNILYCHEGINGALSKPNDKELPVSTFKDFNAVLVGHYHDRTTVGDNIEYIGASRQHNFGEDIYKGYTILYEDGSYEFVQNEANIRYYVEEIVPDQIKELNNKLKETSDRCKVKVKINCTSTEAAKIDKNVLLGAGASKVELVTEDTVETEMTSEDINKKFDKDGIKQEYKNFCKIKDISDAKMGLSYLNKIR